MTWFRVDDGWHSHPKTVGVSLAARGLWASAGSWCAQHLTDGLVPRKMLAIWGAKPRHACELLDAGLWINSEDGYVFHNWADCNPTKAEVLASRAAKSAAGKAGGRASGESRRTKPEAGASVAPEPSGCGVVELPTRPGPTRPGPTHHPSGDSAVDIATTPPAAKKPGRPRGLTKPRPPTADVWSSYSNAYEERYSVKPVSNAKVRGQLASFVQRVPVLEAPMIAEAYVRSNNSRYVAAGHSVGCLLQDAEKMRTELVTGRRGTAHGAREGDRKAGRADAYEQMFAELRAEDEANAKAALS